MLTEILGRSLGELGTMSLVEPVANAMVDRVEVTAVVKIGAVDGRSVDTAIPRVVPGTDETPVIVIPAWNIASCRGTPTGNGRIFYLGKVLDRLSQGLDLAVAGIALGLHFRRQVGDGSLRIVDLRFSRALLLEGIQVGILFSLASRQEVVLAEQGNLVVSQIRNCGRYPRWGGVVKGSGVLHVAE